MTSKNGFDAASLNLPEPTPEDVAALESVEQHNTMSSHDFAEFLRLMTANLPPPRETNSDSDEPFTL